MSIWLKMIFIMFICIYSVPSYSLLRSTYYMAKHCRLNFSCTFFSFYLINDAFL